MAVRFRRVAPGEYQAESANGTPLGTIRDLGAAKARKLANRTSMPVGRWQVSTPSGAGIGYGMDTLAAAKVRLLQHYGVSS